jgi:hypothetical protein
MRHLKFWIVGLLIGLTFLFNLHWLNFGSTGAPGMDRFIYPLAFAAVLSILLIPIFAQVSPAVSLVFWLGVYLALKLTVFSGRPLFGQVYTYLTLTELALLLVLVYLAHRVVGALQQFQRAVEFVTLAQGETRIPTVEESLEPINAEINRSRHSNHAFSVILATPQAQDMQAVLPRLVAEAQQRILQQYVIARLAQTLRSELRRMDMVLEDRKKGRVVIVSPEVDAAGAEALLHRLSAAVNDRLGVGMKYGTASFPDRALTFDDLVRAAEQELRQEAYFQFSDSTGVAD